MSNEVTPEDLLKSLNCPIEACDKEGLTLPYLVKRLHDKIEAKDTKLFAYLGKIEDERDLEAHDVNIRAIDLALKLRGNLRDRLEIDEKITVNVINYSGISKISQAIDTNGLRDDEILISEKSSIDKG